MAKLKTTPETEIMDSGIAPIAESGNEGEVTDPNPEPQPEPTLALSVKTKSVSEAADSFSINVTSNSDWATSSIPSWITLTPSEGNGNQAVKVAYTANTSQTQRTKAITFSVGELTQTLNVTQAAAPAPPPTPTPDPEPEGEEPDDFANQILICFPKEKLMYIDRQGGLYIKDTKEHIRGNAVLYNNPHFKEL